MNYTILGEVYQPKASFPLGGDFLAGDFTPINLSVYNPDLQPDTVSTPQKLGAFVDGVIVKNGARGAFGGYAERRNIYRRSVNYGAGEAVRDVHLGLDIWMPAGTEVRAILPGMVHSYGDHPDIGDYGGTIILEHFMGNSRFYSLYGHLSKKSLSGVQAGQLIQRKQPIGSLGDVHENGDWPPHLHFQVIKDIGGQMGNFPGVCSQNEKYHYLNNCPDPLRFIPEAWKVLVSQ